MATDHGGTPLIGHPPLPPDDADDEVADRVADTPTPARGLGAVISPFDILEHADDPAAPLASPGGGGTPFLNILEPNVVRGIVDHLGHDFEDAGRRYDTATTPSYGTMYSEGGTVAAGSTVRGEYSDGRPMWVRTPDDG